jgi:hypothetical protein
VLGRRPLVLLTVALFLLTGSQLATASSGLSPLRERLAPQGPAKAPKPAKGKGKGKHKGKKPAPVATGNLVLTDQTWTCDGPVNLDSVTVTIDASSAARDAVHLRDGCTGRIGRLVVTQSVGDAVKVAQGAHDLTIGGGSIRCLAKGPNLHQDGIQVMGGARITFQGLSVDCGRAGERLINSNLFIRQSGKSTEPPTDVVCADCAFGAGAAHTVNIQTSVRSGVENSTLCTAKYPKLTLTVGAGAVDPVTVGNTVGAC